MAIDLGSLVAKLVCDVTDLKKGLLEGKADLAGFRQLAEEAGKKVKDVLAFAGISLGIYEVLSKLKEFGREVLEVGSKTEVLRASARTIGSYYSLSAAAIDVYIAKLKEKGVEEEKALYAVNAFLKSGLSIDFLPQLAQAAKDLAPAMAMPFNEAFENIVQGVVKGTPKALAEMVPGIKQAIQAMSSETKKLMDSTILSGPEKAQAMLDLVLQAAQKAQGVGDSVADSYLAKMAAYKRKIIEVKEALFEFVKPIAVAITQEEIKSWDDFYGAIGKNKTALRELGEVVAVQIGRWADFLRKIIVFAAAHKDLLLILLEIKGVLKVLSWVAIAEGAATAAVAVGGLTGKLAVLRLALAGPWGLVIAITLVGAYEAYKQIGNIQARTRQVGKDIEDANLKDAAFKKMQAGEQLSERELKAIATPQQRAAVATAPKITEEEAKAKADRAGAQGKKEGDLGAGAAKKGKTEKIDSLLAPTLAMYKAKREADLQDAQNSLDLLKSTNEKKKTELERALAAQEIDGRTYYLRLQELQQQETTATLAMIAQKRQAEQKSYQDSLTELAADPKLSDEAKEIARQKLAAENKKALSVLDVDAVKARLDGEKKVTDELKRQLEVKKQYQQKTEDLNLETSQLLGAITEQEAKLQRLTLDWQRTKEEAIKAGGYTPEYATALDANYQAKQLDVKYGDQLRNVGSEFSSGVTNIINDVRKGTVDISNSLVEMFNGIMMATLKPGFDALGTALTSAVKWLLNSLSSSLGGGSLFGGSGGGGGNEFSGYGVAGADAHGNAYYHGVRQAFRSGGIVTRPTLFPMATGTGLMGEAGPEGILPLERIGGDLGVKALFPKSGPAQVNIINKTGTEATGTAQQNDDGSIDVFLEKKVLGFASRGPVNQLIKMIVKQG
ncbi:MAG: hypothetical protein WC600_17205 [Desulfobaccales bacterium]